MPLFSAGLGVHDVGLLSAGLSSDGIVTGWATVEYVCMCIYELYFFGYALGLHSNCPLKTSPRLLDSFKLSI